ncbi:polycystic kidney disease protein 1-like 2 [Denticeps clupeoides]|uniref:polycystic kidney disease protein 1-like 2 n=1 Tax=Denticeps clupeoides TaxID=299321 RepID=UPI0010A39229|nr:polycystic kidney disease protein 1-like 2 [Denticeps clupeoides]
MQDLAAVFDNITINVKWLLPQFQGNLTCTLNGGNGHIMSLFTPNGLQEDLEPQNSISPEATIIYQYQTPGVFTVEVDCSTSGLIMTAQKNITIQEPLGEFGAIKCYSINNSMNSEKCVALHGNPVTIQVELKAGTNVTYKILYGEDVLATGSTLEGVAAQNITLGLETMQLFSQGYHQFTILASNGVTTADVSLVLNVFLMEPVGGLEAFFVSQQDHCPSDLHIIVSLEHGAPAQLLFYVSGTNNSFSETKMMTEDHVKVFNISPKIQGMLNVEVKASNLFSSIDLDIGTTVVCFNKSETIQKQDIHSVMTKQYKRLSRETKLSIEASPENPTINSDHVTLTVDGLNGDTKDFQFKWQCTDGNCPCKDMTEDENHIIPKQCLPLPYTFSIYTVTVIPLASGNTIDNNSSNNSNSKNNTNNDKSNNNQPQNNASKDNGSNNGISNDIQPQNNASKDKGPNNGNLSTKQPQNDTPKDNGSSNGNPYDNQPQNDAPKDNGSSNGNPNDNQPQNDAPKDNGTSNGNPNDNQPQNDAPKDNGSSNGNPNDNQSQNDAPKDNGYSNGNPNDNQPQNDAPKDNGSSNGNPNDNQPQNDAPKDNGSSNGNPNDNQSQNYAPKDNGSSNGNPNDNQSQNDAPKDNGSSNGNPNDNQPQNDAPKDNGTSNGNPNDNQPQNDAPKDNGSRNGNPNDNQPQNDAPKDNGTSNGNPNDNQPQNDAPKDNGSSNGNPNDNRSQNNAPKDNGSNNGNSIDNQPKNNGSKDNGSNNGNPNDNQPQNNAPKVNGSSNGNPNDNQPQHNAPKDNGSSNGNPNDNQPQKNATKDKGSNNGNSIDNQPKNNGSKDNGSNNSNPNDKQPQNNAPKDNGSNNGNPNDNQPQNNAPKDNGSNKGNPNDNQPQNNAPKDNGSNNGNSIDNQPKNNGSKDNGSNNGNPNNNQPQNNAPNVNGSSNGNPNDNQPQNNAPKDNGSSNGNPNNNQPQNNAPKDNGSNNGNSIDNQPKNNGSKDNGSNNGNPNNKQPQNNAPKDNGSNKGNPNDNQPQTNAPKDNGSNNGNSIDNQPKNNGSKENGSNNDNPNNNQPQKNAPKVNGSSNGNPNDNQPQNNAPKDNGSNNGNSIDNQPKNNGSKDNGSNNGNPNNNQPQNNAPNVNGSSNGNPNDNQPQNNAPKDNGSSNGNPNNNQPQNNAPKDNESNNGNSIDNQPKNNGSKDNGSNNGNPNNKQPQNNAPKDNGSNKGNPNDNQPQTNAPKDNGSNNGNSIDNQPKNNGSKDNGSNNDNPNNNQPQKNAPKVNGSSNGNPNNNQPQNNAPKDDGSNNSNSNNNQPKNNASNDNNNQNKNDTSSTNGSNNDTSNSGKGSVAGTEDSGVEANDNQNNLDKGSTATKCITVIPGNDFTIKISCSNCFPPQNTKDVQLQLNCDGCNKIVWLTEDQNDVSGFLHSCYIEKGLTPLVEESNQTETLTVPAATLKSASKNILVVAYGIRPDLTSGHAEFIIPVLTSESTTASPTTLASPPLLSCSIFPQVGHILAPFKISCIAPPSFCLPGSCTYCFETASGIYLDCSDNSGDQNVQSVFLPLGDLGSQYIMGVNITVKNQAGEVINTTTSTQVWDISSDTTIADLQILVSNQDARQQEDGVTVVALAQMYQSLSNRLNHGNTEGQDKDAKEKLREQMLTSLCTAVTKTPLKNAMEVDVTAGSVVDLTKMTDELSLNAQLQAGCVLISLSKSLISSTSTKVNVTDGVLLAASHILEAAGNVLRLSANRVEQETINSNLVETVNNVASALLITKQANQGPVVLSTSLISLYVRRMYKEDLPNLSVAIQNSSAASFIFPGLSLSIPYENPVDVRMMSFGMNPFTWSDSQHVNDTVGALSLSTENGSSISVTNLAQEFEIFLPRSEVLQLNSTFLDLRNFSTLMINVTTPNITLVLKLDPSEDVPLHLLLGFQGYPNDTNYNAQTQLPLEGKTQEERYTWVLNSESMAVNQGIYYLLVRPIVGPGVNSTNATVSVTSIAAQCMYWDESHSLWCDSGCRVGPLTTPLVTQCLCNHLTFFGSSFFVMPNTIDLSQIGQLFASFANNPVVVCFVGAILLTYLLVVLWARRQDIQDEAKIKVTVLADNDPLAEYRYLLSISTGHRPRASTSSQVTVTLIGSEGQSEPHHLTATNKPVFYRGAVDMFLLTTPSSLGDLHSIRLWHDNSGHNPSWYVNKVTVQDMETEQKWHFLCDTWLAIDIGEGLLDKVFAVATETDLKGFSNIFFTKTEKDFNDVHLWYSIVNRPATSSFTRVQRTSCCFSMLMCAMLTSIMFYGVPTDPSEQEMEIGQIEFSWQQVMIGIESSLLMFPVNFVIVFLFRNVRQREKKNKNDGEQNPKTTFCKQGKTGKDPSQSRDSLDVHKEVTPDTVIQDIKQIIHTLFKTQKSSSSWVQMTPDRTTDINTLLLLAEDLMQQQKDREQDTFDNSNTAKLQRQKLYDPYLYWQLQNLENNLGKLDSACFLNPESINQALQQIYAIKTHLETQLETVCNTKPLPQVPHSQKENHAKKGLPWWFIFVAWFLVIASTGVSAFFTMLYGLKYGKVRSISWLISTVVSFFQSLFITEPLKVLGLAIFFALVLKRVEKEENNVNFELSTADLDAASRRDSSCHLYKPPPPTNIEKMKKMMIQEQKMFTLIREILVYTGFMWMLLSVAYSQREPSAFFLNQHIQQSFSNNITDSMSLSDVFSWVNTTLLDNLFGEYTGFITDGNSRLVGNARFRQVRVRQDSCPLAQSMRGSVTDCHAPYSWEAEDTGAYWAGWNHSFQMNTSDAALIPWRYQTQSKLRSPTVWGNMAVYRGGGFVMDLGLEKQDAASAVQYLFDHKWLDMYTRAFFVEFTVYNANINLFCIVTLMFETTAVGAFHFRSELQTVRLYQATDGLQIFAMISEVVYIIFILYYMCEQARNIRAKKWAHFKTKWNLVDLSIIALSWSAMGVFIKRTILGNRDVENHQNHKDEYVSFHDTATADDMLGYLIALLVLLATIKLWHLMRLNSKLHLITSILQRAWTQISSYLVVISIMLLAYSIACNLLYGWKLYSYKTLQDSAMTLVNLQLGIFNYDEVMDTNPVLSAFLIGSCIIFMTFIVLNLFISAILHAFSQEKLHHQALEEAEIVDLMLLKLCSLIGIRTKTK